MVKESVIIDRLLRYINENGPQSNIEMCKEMLSEAFVKAVKEENFFKLPINEINDILCMYIQATDECDASAISELIARVSLADPKGGFLLLNSVKLKEPTIEDCIKIISSASGCQICKQLGEIFSEENSIPTVDYEFILKQKEEEIEKLKKESTCDIVLKSPDNKTKYLNFPKTATIGDLKTQIVEDLKNPHLTISSLSIFSKTSKLDDYTLISGKWRENGNILTMVNGGKTDIESHNIRIYVKSLTGKITTLECNQDDRIKDIKAMIEDKEHVPQDKQRLIFAGRQLEDENKLEDYSIRMNATIHLVLRR